MGERAVAGRAHGVRFAQPHEGGVEHRGHKLALDIHGVSRVDHHRQDHLAAHRLLRENIRADGIDMPRLPVYRRKRLAGRVIWLGDPFYGKQRAHLAGFGIETPFLDGRLA